MAITINLVLSPILQSHNLVIFNIIMCTFYTTVLLLFNLKYDCVKQDKK